MDATVERQGGSRGGEAGERGIKGNSHVLMLEKNNKEIAAVIAGWLDKTFKE